MPADTATLELGRVEEERRRLEAERDTGSAPMPLGPEDRAPTGEGPVDTDPATRAHQIVQEVLAAAAARSEAEAIPPDPAAADPGADRARRVVEETLAVAAEARDAHTASPHAEAVPDVRTDLVILSREQPVVLVPGPLHLPAPVAYVPPRRSSLTGLVDAAFATAADESEVRSDGAGDDLAAPETLTAAIRGAAESSMHGVRWVVVAAAWALAFALLVPVAFRGFVSSVDLTVDLWGEQDSVTEPAAQTDGADAPAPTDG